MVISYLVRCIPSDDFDSLFGVTDTISSESGEVGDFTLAADYICFFTASTSAGMGPETTTGLDVTTCKFHTCVFCPILGTNNYLCLNLQFLIIRKYHDIM